VDGLGENPFQVTSLFHGKVTAIGLRSEEIVERIERDTDLIGVSCMFSQDWPEIRRLIRMVRHRFPGVRIVAGGEHITATPAFTLGSTPEVDVCVLGEGEETIVDLATAADAGGSFDAIPGLVIRADGSTRSTGSRQRIRNLDDIPWPAWDLVPLDHYLDHGLGYGVNRGRSMPMIATRGCPYECTFCSNPEMWTTSWYARDPEKVLDEIQAYQERYGASNFDFYDLTAIVKRSWIAQFTQSILDRRMVFTWQLPSGTRSEAIDGEISRLLYASGCRNMSYAPESGSPEVLDRIKKVVKLDRLEASVVGAVRAGLNVKLNIIMGFPNESRRELGQTLRFLARMGLAGVHDMSISLFSPYPGSELYHELRKSGKIPELSDDYFLGLGAYKDFFQSSSYAEGVGPRILNFYRILGFLIFYGTQYAVHPWRPALLLRNLLRHRQESRLDKSLQDFADRIRNRWRTSHARAHPRTDLATVGVDQPAAMNRTVTVVISTRDDDVSIVTTIDSVMPYADEVVIVNGQGEGVQRAIHDATTGILVFVDADSPHDPHDIPRLVEPIQLGEADLVIGSRARGGSDQRHGTLEQFIRYVGAQLITLAINYRWNVRLTDSQNGFRAIRRTVAARLGLSSSVTTSEQEMLMKALKQGYRVSEIASHEYARGPDASNGIAWKRCFVHLRSFVWNFF
jgi:radical SAM superfamily enzyme YgiQ (UPF0313 family)